MLRQVCLRALQQPVRGQALRSGWPALLATSTSRSASSRSGKDTDEFGDNEVHVPADLSSIAHLNPELHSVLVGSAIHASESRRESLGTRLRHLLEAEHVKSTSLTASSLLKLPASVLREELARQNVGTSGTKVAIVGKLLDLVQDETRRAASTSAEPAPSAPLSGPAGFTKVFRTAAMKRPSADHDQEAPPTIYVEPAEIAEALAAAHARDVVLLDISRCCPFATHFVIASGRSPPQLRGQAEAVLDLLERRADREGGVPCPAGIEGAPGAEWLVVDVGPTLVHLLTPAARAYYDLEGLWTGQGAELTRVEAPASAQQGAETLDRMRADVR